MSLLDFEIGKTLGKGVFGSVSLVKRKEDKEIYAMKRVNIGDLTKKELENSFNEVRLLASLNHKNVIGYREAFYDKKSKTLNIVMEYANDGDLSTKINQMKKYQKYFEESTIWKTLIQILEGLKYLHNSKIIHRDLKSANIFLNKNGEVKIGDLNVSKIVRKNMALTQTGTPYYASPEIWNDHPYDYKCDIWSAGCIIYEMAALKLPFRGSNMQTLYNNVMKGIFDPLPSRYSHDLMEIIKQILIKNPRKRPSAENLLKNEIILKRIELLGELINNNDEKALLMRTIKIPKNMNQINQQMPKKNYKNNRYKNQMEMFENDEYETAKNSFYGPKSNYYIVENKENHKNNYKLIDNFEENSKIKNIKNGKKNKKINKSINNKDYYYNFNFYYNDNVKLNNIINKNIKNHDFNNHKCLNIYSINYNRNKKPIKKVNNYNWNKEEKKINENKMPDNKRSLNTESLRISTSNVIPCENKKSYKNQISLNAPIKIILNQKSKNNVNNFYSNKDNRYNYIPLSLLTNDTSSINDIYNSNIIEAFNNNINESTSISPILKRKKINGNINNEQSLEKNQRKKNFNYNKKMKIKNNISINMENKRNKSLKEAGNIIPLYFEEISNQILNKKKNLNINHVKRNISTDFMARKNSFLNERENFCSKNNSYIFPKNENIKESFSNNNRIIKLKKQFINAIPYMEFENVFKKRLSSENNGNIRSNNNIKIRLNCFNNLNIEQNRTKKFSLGKNLPRKSCYEDCSKKLSMRPKSTSSIAYHDKSKIRNVIRPIIIGKNSNIYNKNLTEIYDLRNQRNKSNNNKYKDLYHIYYQKYIDNKIKNNQNKINKNNYNQNEFGTNDNQRKIIYEKINIVQKNGESRKYIKGPAIIRIVGKGNLNNQIHKEIFKNQNILNEYSIQSMNNKEYKFEKCGPRIILPKKMIIPN